ncbi:MAG: hypothetical protein AB7F43_00365 [Bacteriovoracia bacterium]
MKKILLFCCSLFSLTTGYAYENVTGYVCKLNDLRKGTVLAEMEMLKNGSINGSYRGIRDIYREKNDYYGLVGWFWLRSDQWKENSQGDFWVRVKRLPWERNGPNVVAIEENFFGKKQDEWPDTLENVNNTAGMSIVCKKTTVPDYSRLFNPPYPHRQWSRYILQEYRNPSDEMIEDEFLKTLAEDLNKACGYQGLTFIKDNDFQYSKGNLKASYFLSFGEGAGTWVDSPDDYKSRAAVLTDGAPRTGKFIIYDGGAMTHLVSNYDEFICQEMCYRNVGYSVSSRRDPQTGKCEYWFRNQPHPPVTNNENTN